MGAAPPSSSTRTTAGVVREAANCRRALCPEEEDRLWADRTDVINFVRNDAVFFVCGNERRMASAVHDTCSRILVEATGATPEQADAWLTEMEREHGRYVTDAFA